MSQISSSSKKTWGFLVFTLGCIIAISGAAKLHPQENIMRTRGMLEKITKRTIVGTLSPVVAKSQERLVAASLQKQSDAQLSALFQSIYDGFLKQGVSSFSFKDPIAVTGTLKPGVQKALLLLWKGKAKKKKSKATKDFGLQVLAEVVKSMSSKSGKVAKSGRGSRARSLSPLQVPAHFKKIVSTIRDVALARLEPRLVPYLLWDVMEQQSKSKVSSMAHAMAAAKVVPELAKLGIATLNMKDAMERAGLVASAFARSVAKKLKLKSKNYALKLSAAKHMNWAKRLAPAQSNIASLQVARELSYALADLVTAQYAGFVTEQLAKRMRIERHSVKAPASPAVRRAPAPPRVATKPTSRPSSQPAVVARRTPPPTPKRATPPTAVKLGSFLTLAGKKDRIGGWPNTLPIFLFGILMAFLGLLFWKRGVAMEAAAAMEAQSNDASNPFTLLAEIQDPLEALQKDIDSLNEEEVCNRVDEILSTYVLPFAEVRRGVIDRLGMEQGAEILVVVAYGERMLNRVWSAASDGHLPEARSVLPDAISAFSEAGTLSQKA